MIRNQAAVVGVGYSRIGRRLGRPVGLLAKDAVDAAIVDAGLTHADIDGAATHPIHPVVGDAGGRDGDDRVSLRWMVRHGGLSNVGWFADCQLGNVSTVIQHAVTALSQGLCSYAVVWRALGIPQAGGYQADFDSERASGSFAFSLPYGLSGAPMGFALTYNRYLKLYGATREHMAALAIAQRRGANANPYAHFKDVPLSREGYLSGRMVADPLSLYDCDIPVDGAGAIILARADRAADLPNRPAYVVGTGQAGFNFATVGADIGTTGPQVFEDCRTTAATVGRSLWANTGLKPSDMDGAMLYDGFGPDVYFWLEGMGFCGEGEGFEFIQDGRIEIGGELPVNTHGGNLSQGRIHGIGHWIEAVLQVQGRAERRQIAGARNIAVASGLLANGSGAVISSEPGDAR